MNDKARESRVQLGAEQLARSFDEGYNEGLEAGRRDILDWLEHAYLNDPGRPDRGTPKAEAILEVARAASKHINHLTKIRRGRR